MKDILYYIILYYIILYYIINIYNDILNLPGTRKLSGRDRGRGVVVGEESGPCRASAGAVGGASPASDNDKIRGGRSRERLSPPFYNCKIFIKYLQILA